jgi:hypothetical protein
VIEKETEESEKDLIELSDEGFDFVEDSKFVIEGIEKIRSESKNCATLESVRNEVTEIADQSICQDKENMGSEVEIIESFQERAEDYFDESDDESVDSQTLPDIETEDSYSSQSIKEQLQHSEPIKLLTPEFPKDLTPEPMKALTPEPTQTKDQLPEFKLSEPCQLPSEALENLTHDSAKAVTPEPPTAFSDDFSRPSFETSKAPTLASPPVFDPQLASVPAYTELLDSLASPMPDESLVRASSSEKVTAVDDISREVQVVREI